MNAAEAVVVLRKHAQRDASREIAEAIGEVIDHVARVEQALQLIEASVKSALDDKPANAVIGVNTKRRI